MDDEDIWQESPHSVQDTEWEKLASGFTNAGYREGITAGKESALQAGFDEGFADVGVPIGRQLGILRGIASALISFLSTSHSDAQHAAFLDEVRNIASQLNIVRFSDIAPPDVEAEHHAREHLGNARLDDVDEADIELPEQIQEKRTMESLEDLMAQMGGPVASGTTKRPTMDDVRQIQERLLAICEAQGLPIQWS